VVGDTIAFGPDRHVSLSQERTQHWLSQGGYTGLVRGVTATDADGLLGELGNADRGLTFTDRGRDLFRQAIAAFQREAPGGSPEQLALVGLHAAMGGNPTQFNTVIQTAIQRARLADLERAKKDANERLANVPSGQPTIRVLNDGQVTIGNVTVSMATAGLLATGNLSGLLGSLRSRPFTPAYRAGLPETTGFPSPLNRFSAMCWAQANSWAAISHMPTSKALF
jgi:hypothetical protein